MSSGNEEYLKTKIDLCLLLLKSSVIELNAHRFALLLLGRQNPRLKVEELLDGCRKNKGLQQDSEEQIAHVAELLSKYDSAPQDEALEMLRKWTPPKSPPN